ncbi:unnamed protein product [Diatraea saccharalis]|uniref:AEBP2-like C-terminal SH3 domain-containing protein n=1 Tax=Diatraea saccharalis TaxID=40085 RepID=A0A9N9R958_9NEOP|nr:unnamed protein product [Diatraea saccharalis]
MFDFFDAGTMEGLAWRLTRVTRWRLGGACPLREPGGRHTLTLTATLHATRYNAAARRTEALLVYHPPHVVEDEWVPVKEVRRTRRVEISQLTARAKVTLYDQFCAAYSPAPAPAPPPAAPAPRPPRAAPRAPRALSALLARRPPHCRGDCGPAPAPAPHSTAPPQAREEDSRPEVSGAKKRKMGRRYGGDCFWPSGR